MTATDALTELLTRLQKEDSALYSWVKPIIRELQIEIERERFLCGETNGIPAELYNDRGDPVHRAPLGRVQSEDEQ